MPEQEGDRGRLGEQVWIQLHLRALQVLSSSWKDALRLQISLDLS